MNDEEKKTEENTEVQNKSFLFLYIAIGCFAAGLILFVLSFFIKGAGVYFIISAMICELAAVSFINAQKRKANNKLCFVFTILSYVVMAAALAVFIAGMSVGSANK